LHTKVLVHICPGLHRSLVLLLSVLAGATLPARPANAQSVAPVGAGALATAATGSPATTSSAAQDDEDDDAVLDPAEPDFVVVNLPSTLRLPVLKGNFRLTHRFAGNLRNGSFSQQASNLFGLDQGAIIGFEYRFGIMRGLQAAAYRTNFDKTIQFYAKYDPIRQSESMPLSISGLLSVEGTDNFQEHYAPAVGVVVSRKVADRFAAYLVPIWVDNTAASLVPIDHTHDETDEEEHDAPRRSTFYVGVGGRLRLTSTVYVVGEVTPRLGGYRPDEAQYGFGVEKRVGGHAFSLTFTNSFGTTYAQIARGGIANSLYLGFNLGRKFF
jgi:hypothetical protein